MDSLGRTTCLTGTDTVGADFNANAAAAVIADVDATPASVTAALDAISGGTLEGQVPALGLINAVDLAVADQAAFEVAGKADADALVAKLAANVKTGTFTDTVKADTDATYAEKIEAAVKDADQFRSDVSGKTTAVLQTEAGEAATALTTAFGKLSSAEKTLANAYTAAISAEATAHAGVATSTEKGAAIGGLAADETATTALNGTTAGAVYTNYVNGDATARAAIDTKFAGSSFYNTFKAAAVKDAAYADAVKATASAKDALDLTPTDAADEQLALTQAQSDEAAAQQALVTSAQKKGVQADLANDAEASAALVVHGGSVAELYQELYDAHVAGTDTTATEAQFTTSGVVNSSYEALAALASTDADTAAAYSDATGNTSAAQIALTAALQASATDGGASTGSAAGTDYVHAIDAKTTADKLVADAQAADTNKAAAHALDDAYAVKTDATEAAQSALDDFKADGVELQEIAGAPVNATFKGTANVKDVFYFEDKLTATSVTTNDFKIASFGAGDSLVLGNSFTYNSGAVTTGDNNKQEFFLVKSDAGVQVVLESANYGSSEVTPNATTGAITSTANDHVQVITLSGVANIADVTVHNGVISHVA